MTKRLPITTALMTAFASLLALLLLSSPVFAHHKADHDKGKTKASTNDSDTKYTEDNDTNDGGTANNVSDEGDNKHPSGKDRSVENGKSGNQGNSSSDPDDDGRGPDRSNGGPDKPNGSGGDDLADQDGNNGCGNDDDFEDDNEGWCGKPPKDETDEPEVLPTTPTPSPCPTDMVEGSTEETCGEPTTEPTDVLGDDVSDEEKECPEEPTMALEVEGCEVVLGSIIEADGDVKDDVEAAGVEADGADAPAERAAGAALPFTGGDVVLFLVLAMGLLGVGFALLRTRRN
jgi:hypothetical protein